MHFGHMLTGNCKAVLLRFALAGLEKVMREFPCCGPFRCKQSTSVLRAGQPPHNTLSAEVAEEQRKLSSPIFLGSLCWQGWVGSRWGRKQERVGSCPSAKLVPRVLLPLPDRPALPVDCLWAVLLEGCSTGLDTWCVVGKFPPIHFVMEVVTGMHSSRNDY